MESNQHSSPKAPEESGRSIARNRPKRWATKRSSLFGYNECDVCKKIENLEYLIQYENSLGNNHKSTSIRNNEEKLKQLRNHVCNNYYISLEDYADEDFCFDYYPIQRTPTTRASRKRNHQKEDEEEEYQGSDVMSKPKPRKMSRFGANSSASGIEEIKNKKITEKSHPIDEANSKRRIWIYLSYPPPTMHSNRKEGIAFKSYFKLLTTL